MRGKLPKVSVVIGSYNRYRFLKLTIDSVRKELHNRAHEIIVVDGGSTDRTLRWLIKQKDVISIVQHNRGLWQGKPIARRSWGYFMNLGFKCAEGKYVCMLSDDCLVVPGAIVNGVREFEAKLEAGEKAGAMAFYWRNWPEEQEYKVGYTLGDKMFVNHGLYLKEALATVAYADENSYNFYHADGDLCLKMWQADYACLDSSHSYIEHFSHANEQVKATNLVKLQEDHARYLTNWQGLFYDPNNDNQGYWQRQAFFDPYHTAQQFKRLFYRSKFSKTIRRAISKLKP